MASLSNINGLFDVHSTGAILFSTSHGTSGQILKSNGNAAPTWVNASTVIGGPYLPLSGGTLTGATATASGISFTVGGVLTGTTATFSGTVTFNDHTYHPDQVKSIFGTGSDAEIQFNGSHLFIDNTVGTTYLRNTGTGGSGFIFRNSNIGDFEFDNEFAGNIKFNTSNIERMRIDSSGKVGINTTVFPSSGFAKLVVAGGAIAARPSGVNDYFSYIKSNWALENAFEIGIEGAGTQHRFITSGNYYHGTELRFWSADTQRMTINSVGNVGIGTTSPDYLLDLSKTAVSVDTYSGINLQASNYGYTIEGGLTQNIGGELIFSSNNAGTRNERVRFAANGNVGIGTNDPQNPLHIKKEGYQLKLEDGNTTNTCEILASNNTMGFFSDRANAVASSDMIFSIDNDTKMVIDTNGNVGIGTTSPDAKLEVASDITIQNGVYTYKTGGYTSGATAINVDITVGNEGGAGNVFKIEAGFAHYFSMTYNSVAEWWCTSRGTSVVNTYILNAGTTLAGDWSASKPNTTTLRITKTAGTYGGGGKWWVKVTYVPF